MTRLTAVTVIGAAPWLAARPAFDLWGDRRPESAAAAQQQADARTQAELRRAVADAERFGPDDPRLATSLNALAVFYASHNRPDLAEPLYRRALQIRERALGPNHPDVVRSLNNLAGLYALERRYADAEAVYRRALAINERAAGPDAASTGVILKNLASLYISQARYGDAIPVYQRLLAIREKTLGRRDPELAMDLNLGRACTGSRVTTLAPRPFTAGR
jgi:tetratricopeptide (TPR) repeat protein